MNIYKKYPHLMSPLLDLPLSSKNKGRTLPTAEREEILRDKRQ
jgi:hypothetical protein